MKDIINAGLSEIPKNCRLSEAVRDTMHWCETLTSWELVWEKINESVGHYHGVHTINNASLIVMGLYFGENDFEKGIVCTVRGGGYRLHRRDGWLYFGYVLEQKSSLKVVSPLNDRLKSVVRDENDNKISDLLKEH